MSIILSPRAKKSLRILPKLDQIAIANKIRSLTDRGDQGEEKLSGYSNIFRVREGSYRIVYRKTSQSVYIILVTHRRDVYRMLRDILG